jgi:hypothetical protein
VNGVAGANVSVEYVGGLNTTWDPITDPYSRLVFAPSMFIGTWVLSTDPKASMMRPLLMAMVLLERLIGCSLEDSKASGASIMMQVTPSLLLLLSMTGSWQHCIGMHVGETYEVHWLHFSEGACGTTPNQYQTYFYDGVFLWKFCTLTRLI